MNDLHFDPSLGGSQEKICMGCGAEGVSDYQKGVISFFIFGDTVEQVIDLNLAEIPVSFDEGHPQKFLKIFVRSAHN